MFIRSIVLGVIAIVGADAFAIPMPHTFPMVEATKSNNPVDPALQDWFDEYAGVHSPELLSQEEFNDLLTKYDPGVRLYLKLVRNPRSVTAEDVKSFLQPAANQKMKDGKLLAPSIYYDLLKNDILGENDRSKVQSLLAEQGENSCVQKLRTLDDISADKLGQMSDEGIRLLLARINEFRSQNFRRKAMRQVMDYLPAKRRDPLKDTLLSYVSQHMSVLRSYDWMTEYYEKADRSRMDKQTSALDDIRRLSGRKQCSKARGLFFSLLKTNPKKELLEDVMTAGKAVDTCLRSRDANLRFKFWADASEELERVYKFNGWAEANLRMGYLHWARDDMDDARRIFGDVIAKSNKYPEIKAKALYSLARVNENAIDYDEAAKDFKEFITEFPQSEHFSDAIESLVLIYSDKADWASAIDPLENMIKLQDLLDYDDRSVGSHSFALFWAGRIYLELGRKKEAAEAFRRVASEYYSTFYGALGHYLLEKVVGKKLVLEPVRTPGFNFNQILTEFSPQDQERMKRVLLMLRLGLKSDALCEMEEVDTEGGKPERALTRALVLYASGQWLEAIKAFDALPRSFRNTLPTGFERILFPSRYEEIVREDAKKLDVDPDLILAIIRQESVFNPMARSPVGAHGLMQLMPATAKHEASRLTAGYVDKATKAEIKKKVRHKKDLLVPETNLLLGIHHVRTLLTKYTNPVYVLSAYNASPSAAERWMAKIPNHDILTFIERIPYKETRAYVKLVMRNYFYYKRWYGLNTDNLIHLDSLTSPLASLAKLDKKGDVKELVPNH